MPKPIGHHRPLNGNSVSVVGGDTCIVGNVNATADLHIDGKVEGDVTCSALVQGESSHINGGIKAGTVRIAGKVEGTIAAREVIILKSARIIGDVTYDALTIEQGAQMDGRLHPRSSQHHGANSSSSHAGQSIARSPDGDEARLILAAPDKA